MGYTNGDKILSKNLYSFFMFVNETQTGQLPKMGTRRTL